MRQQLRPQRPAATVAGDLLGKSRDRVAGINVETRLLVLNAAELREGDGVTIEVIEPCP